MDQSEFPGYGVFLANHSAVIHPAQRRNSPCTPDHGISPDDSVHDSQVRILIDLLCNKKDLWHLFRFKESYSLRGSRPVLSCENGRESVSVENLRPTDRSQNFGRTKLLFDSETVGRAQKIGRTKSIIDSSIFHSEERAVNRVARS
jgi:hypothetical protein